jgi:chemotaxis receptor (MCP) glutamine deamidase CheD
MTTKFDFAVFWLFTTKSIPLMHKSVKKTGANRDRVAANMFTDADVLAIRAIIKPNKAALGRQYNCAPSTILRLITGKTFSHLPLIDK